MSIPEYSFSVLVAANVVMAVAGALQASVGFGLALLAVPILTLLDPNLVPGPMLLAGSVLAAVTAFRDRSEVDKSGLLVSLVGMAIGTVLGAFLLSLLRTKYLNEAFGLAVLAAIVMSASGVQVRPTRPKLFCGGTAAGIMGTMVGLHGPPIALLFQATKPAYARAMLGMFFFIAYIGAVVAYTAFGMFGLYQLSLSVALLPGVVLGLLAARSLIRLINPYRMRWVILLVSAASAVAVLARSGSARALMS